MNKKQFDEVVEYFAKVAKVTESIRKTKVNKEKSYKTKNPNYHKERYHRIKKEEQRSIDRELSERFKAIVAEQLGKPKPGKTVKPITNTKVKGTHKNVINIMGSSKKDLLNSFRTFLDTNKTNDEPAFWQTLITWAESVTMNDIIINSNREKRF